MKTQEVHDRLDQLLPSDEIPDDTMELIPVRNRVRKWAACNAYLLIYLTIMFGINWAVTLIASH